jgi:hypothetical protein
VTKSAGMLPWLAPVMGIIGGVTAHWLIVRAAPTARERRLKTFAFTGLWLFVFGWLLAVQPALHALSRHLQWSDSVFFQVMAGFWWFYGMVLATLSVMMFRRVFIIRQQALTAGDAPSTIGPPPMKTGRLLLVGGVYLACFSWLLGLAWRTGDRISIVIITAAMVLLGALNIYQVGHRTGLAALRAVIGHLALVWVVILVMLNWRLDLWLATIRGIDLPQMHQLLSMTVVHWLTLALLIWIGLVVAATKHRTTT